MKLVMKALPGILTVLVLSSSTQARSSEWQVSFDTGRRASADGRYQQAEQQLRAALENLEGAKKNDRRLWQTLEALAELYQNENKWLEAETVLWRCLEAQEAAFGAQAEQLVPTMSDLENVYVKLGETEKASKIEQLISSLNEHLSATSTEESLSAIKKMTEIYKDFGKDKISKDLLKAEDQLVKKSSGSTSGRLLLGRVVRKQLSLKWIKPLEAADLTEQLAAVERLKIEKTTLEQLVSNEKQTLEKLFADKVRLEAQIMEQRLVLEALKKERASLEAERAVARETTANPEITTAPTPVPASDSAVDTAKLEGDLAPISANPPLPEEASLLKMLESLKTNTSTSTANSVAAEASQLAEKYLSKGDTTRAEFIYKQTYNRFDRVGLKETPAGATLASNLAGLYFSGRRFAMAEQLYTDALSVYERTLGLNHRYISGAIHNLAVVLAQQGKMKEVEALYQRMLALREKTLAADDVAVADSLFELGNFYLAKKNYERAEAYLKRSLSIRTQKLPSKNADVLAAIDRYAKLLRATNRNNEAEQLEARSVAARLKGNTL